MAAKDAEMPAQRALSDDIQEIANHLANLRKDLEALTGQIKRTGDHQLERMQDTAGEALKAVEDACGKTLFPRSALPLASVSWSASCSAAEVRASSAARQEHLPRLRILYYASKTTLKNESRTRLIGSSGKA